VSFREGYPGNVYRAVLAEAPLGLHRDPTNEVDPLAIAVVRDDTGELLGFLQRNAAKQLAPLIDAGELWVVSSSSVAVADNGTGKPGLRLDLQRVEWAEDPPTRTAQMGFEPRRQKPAIRHDPRAWANRVTALAREEGRKPRRVGEDHYAVESGSKPGVFYSVVLDVDEHRLVHCLCQCEGAVYHPDLPIACSHAAAVIDMLVERGSLRRIGGLAYSLPTARAMG
jgi:hypothetical protein